MLSCPNTGTNHTPPIIKWASNCIKIVLKERREEFRQELLAQVNELATPQDGGEEIRQSALAKAQRIAEEELSVPGWSAQGLARTPEGRPAEGPHRSAFAPRDDDDVAVDCRPAVPGGGDACCLSAATPSAQRGT